jgi:peptidoglycan hydrolase-like protein with peptidoglycan-binding domain
LHAQLTRFDDVVLRAGAQGAAVRFVQQRLRIRADGVFGPQTHIAVVHVQRRHHLQADGVVGPRTWRAIG